MEGNVISTLGVKSLAYLGQRLAWRTWARLGTGTFPVYG